jgi:hypothetical protein
MKFKFWVDPGRDVDDGSRRSRWIFGPGVVRTDLPLPRQAPGQQKAELQLFRKEFFLSKSALNSHAIAAPHQGFVDGKGPFTRTFRVGRQSKSVLLYLLLWNSSVRAVRKVDTSMDPNQQLLGTHNS